MYHVTINPISLSGVPQRQYRLGSLCDVVFLFFFLSATLAPRKEVLTFIAGSSSHQADVYLPCGGTAAIDVTVISPVQQQLTVGREVHASTVGGDRKCHIHDNACHEAGITFIPLVAESFGGWSREGADTIRAIGKHQALRLAARKNTPTQIQKRESGDETRISPTEFVDGSVYVNLDVRRVDFKPIPLQATNQLVHSVWRVNVTIFFLRTSRA